MKLAFNGGLNTETIVESKQMEIDKNDVRTLHSYFKSNLSIHS